MVEFSPGTSAALCGSQERRPHGGDPRDIDRVVWLRHEIPHSQCVFADPIRILAPNRNLKSFFASLITSMLFFSSVR